MIPVPSPLEGVSVECDPRSNTWVVASAECRCTLRPWTWTERRRIVRAATLDGAVHRQTLLDAIADLLLDPAPAGSARDKITLASLLLLGERDDAPQLSLQRRELALAKSLGWRPHELDREDVQTLDELALQLAPAAAIESSPGTPLSAAPPRDDGWTRIVFTPPAKLPEQPPAASREPQPLPDPETATRAVLDKVAGWAGFPERPRRETVAESAQPNDNPQAPAAVPLEETTAPTKRGLPFSWAEQPRAAVRLRRSHNDERRQLAPTRHEPSTTRTAAVSTAPDRLETIAMPVRVNVRWPELVRENAASPEFDSTPLIRRVAASLTSSVAETLPVGERPQLAGERIAPENPFSQSELEEQLADVLDRAAREAGVDLS